MLGVAKFFLLFVCVWCYWWEDCFLVFFCTALGFKIKNNCIVVKNGSLKSFPFLLPIAAVSNHRPWVKRPNTPRDRSSWQPFTKPGF